MSLFMIIACPAFCLGWFLSLPKYERISFIPALLWGFLSAIVVCTIKAFFIFSNHIWTASFVLEFLQIFLKDTLLPCALLPAVYFLFSKDSWDFKADSFLPLMISFYTVFLPYRIFRCGEKLSFFMLFVKPVLYISMIAFVSAMLHNLIPTIINKDKSKAIKLSAITLGLAIVPALVQSFWYYGGKIYFWLPVSIIYSAAGFIIYSNFKKETISEPIFMSM